MKQTNYSQQLGELVKSAKETIKQYCDGGKECDCKEENFGAVCESEIFSCASVTDGYIRAFDYDGICICELPYESEEESEDECGEFFSWNEVLNESVICELADALVSGTIKVKEKSYED